MSGFSADWLALREPLDAASRAAGFGSSLIEALAPGQGRPSRRAIVDLAGTGANLRYLAPLLGGSQDWLLVDGDRMLLGAVRQRMLAWARAAQLTVGANAAQPGADQPLNLQGERFDCRVRTLELNLASQLQALPLGPGTLLTASALLDLVSEQWLRALAGRAAAAAAPLWFALNYDGRIDCQPAEPEDAEIRTLFNQHQRSDKGFGPALGPTAGPLAQQIFAQHGYRIHCAPSDWIIGPEHPALQRALVEGWFTAACEIAPPRAAVLRGWLARRRAHIDAASCTLRVGHVDLAGQCSAAI